MERKEFIDYFLNPLSETALEQLKSKLVGIYLEFDYLAYADITKAVLAEKLSDYFEKVELKNRMVFNKQLDAYTDDLDSIVESRIEDSPRATRRGEAPPAVPRARRYYDRVANNRRGIEFDTEYLLGFSRIMFCLYTAIIRNDFKEINNFNYSASCLSMDEIIGAMKEEKDRSGRWMKFEPDKRYSTDSSTFVITIMILCWIIDTRVQGEYYHG